jgi:hypothetical protein
MGDYERPTHSASWIGPLSERIVRLEVVVDEHGRRLSHVEILARSNESRIAKSEATDAQKSASSKDERERRTLAVRQIMMGIAVVSLLVGSYRLGTSERISAAILPGQHVGPWR